MFQIILAFYMHMITRKKVIWAKNYKVPFRSNLKISEDKLLASNQIIIYIFQ